MYARRRLSLIVLVALAACDRNPTIAPSPDASVTTNAGTAPVGTVAPRPTTPAPIPSASPSPAASASASASADTPINSDNYAAVMEARWRAYDRLEYKPVTLSGFSCGDNCYVELTENMEGQAPVRLLCTARLCADWRDRGAPPRLAKGRLATAKFGKADQRDDAGNVMARQVRAVVDLRLGAPAPDTRATPTPTSATPGTLPLRPGVYVLAGSRCKNPANAAFRIWTGRGLSGSATRACRAGVLRQRGTAYRIANSCEATYDGKRSSENLAIDVLRRDRFRLDEGTFTRCADGEAPGYLEELVGK